MKRLTDEQRELAAAHLFVAKECVRGVLRAATKHVADDAELRSAADLAICQLAADYTPGPVPFRAFARKYIRARTVDILRATFGRERGAPHKWTFVRGLRQFDTSPDGTPCEELLVSREPDVGRDFDAAEYVERVTRHLPPNQRAMLRAVLGPGAPTATEVGARLGYKDARACQLVREAVAALRDRVDLFA